MTQSLSGYGLSQSTDGSYTFDGDALISSGEQGAVGSLGDAIEQAIKEEASMAAFAASFTAGLVGAEAGVAAAAGGATIASAVAAGEAAGQAAAVTVGGALTTGPGAALLILALAIVIAEGGDTFAFLDGFDPFSGGHESCCGAAPDPTPKQYVQVGSTRMYFPSGVTVTGAKTETKTEAIQRATQYAIQQNAASCAGNHTIVDFVGAMPGMPVDGAIIPTPGDDPRLVAFTTLANNLLYQYINAAGLTKCWPLAQRASTGHLLAMALAAWNAKYAGPSVTLTRTFRPTSPPYADLIGLALDWGNLQWMTTQGQGYLGSVLPGTSATIHLSVNVGPATDGSSSGGASGGGGGSGGGSSAGGSGSSAASFGMVAGGLCVAGAAVAGAVFVYARQSGISYREAWSRVFHTLTETTTRSGQRLLAKLP